MYQLREESNTTGKRGAYLAEHRVVRSHGHRAGAAHCSHPRLCTPGCSKAFFLPGHSFLLSHTAQQTQLRNYQHHRQRHHWLSTSNTSLGFASSQCSVMAAQGPRLLSKKGFMSPLPGARCERAWLRWQQMHCQKPYSQEKDRAVENKWQHRIKESAHPWGWDIPGFPVTPAKGTQEGLQPVPAETRLPEPRTEGKPVETCCSSAGGQGPEPGTGCMLLFEAWAEKKHNSTL